MEQIIKQVVGVDVSKDTLDANLSFLQQNMLIKNIETKRFSNSKSGIKEMIKWFQKRCEKSLPVLVVCEATGVYYELLAYSMHESNYNISVVLPNKINHFMKSNNIRNITDKVSAQQIAEFGLVRNLDLWEPPSKTLREMKGLCRERSQLIEDKTRHKNRKHAQDVSIVTDNETMKRTKSHISFISKQIKEIEKQIRQLINENPDLAKKINNIQSIDGVGFITAATVVAETDGFHLVRNGRQLVCYAGLDVVAKESGTSVQTKGRISHRGNKYIRRALYFPAITNVKNQKSYKNFYDRVFEKSHIKMKAYVAVQRKMLMLMYTLWKNNVPFDPDYESKKAQNVKAINKIEQPKKAALIELVLDRSV